MPRALWLLLGMQLRGWGRYLARNVATLKGALLAIVGLTLVVAWVVPLLLLPRGFGSPPELFLRYGPVGLLAYCVLNVQFSLGERGIYFSPAEVQFLFPGPFTRRQVLAYKVVLSVLVALPTGLIMAVAINIQGTSFAVKFLGMLLVFVLMQLGSTALGLLNEAVGAHLATRGRRAFAAVVVLLAAVAFWQAGGLNAPGGWGQRLDALLDTPAWQAVSVPLAWPFQAMLATGPLEVLAYTGLTLLLVFALLLLIFGLDADYQEAAAAGSARIYAQVQRMRGKMVHEGEEASAFTPRWSLPSLPYWGGIGPVLWRQLTTASRGLGRLALTVVFLSVLLAVPLFSEPNKAREAMVAASFSMLGTMTVFLTVMVPFDFRGDIDRMATLKALPVPAWTLAVGQVLVPVLVLTLLQWAFLAVLLVLVPNLATVVLAGAAFAPPFNFLVIALENLLFLLFPVRIMAAQPGDFQSVGRNVLLVMAKFLGLMVTGSVAGGVGVLVYFLTDSLPLALAAAWPVVALAGLALIPLIALAFRAFDVGRDTPA